MSSQYESQVIEIGNKFKRLVHHLGNNNSSGLTYFNGSVKKTTGVDGIPIGPSDRYKFEVEFAYLLDEISKSPDYIVQKLLDKSNILISELIAKIKDLGEDSIPTDE